MMQYIAWVWVVGPSFWSDNISSVEKYEKHVLISLGYMQYISLPK